MYRSVSDTDVFWTGLGIDQFLTGILLDRAVYRSVSDRDVFWTGLCIDQFLTGMCFGQGCV